MPETLPSVCPLDCPDTCSLAVTVEDGRVVKVRGSNANPYTHGSICAKVARYPEWVHGADRIATPLARAGAKGEGAFRRCSWDEALDRIHAAFTEAARAHGPESILPFSYAGPHGMLATSSMDRRFFHRLGASKLDRAALCGGVKSQAWSATFGAVPAMRPEDVEHARLIVVWGLNVTVSALHLMTPIRRAVASGATLIVVDPRRTPVAARAHEHLRVRPGTDVVLAFAIAAELERIGGVDRGFVDRHVKGADAFLARAREWTPERAAAECGVDAEAIRRVAALYRDASPAAICPGNGPERNRNGGSGLRAAFALAALAGKFGVRGGGVLQGAGASFPVTADRLERAGLAPEGTRTLNIVDIGRHLVDDDVDPPLRAVLVYNHNPLVVHPDQNRMRRGLAREEVFLAVADTVMTDTTRYADVVLPACTHFEHDDVFRAYGTHWLQRARAVIPPVGEALPNTEIFRRLARRFGFDGEAFEADDAALMDDAFDADDPRLGGARPSELPLDRAVPMRFDGEDAMLFVSTFPKTPSGRIELESDALDARWGRALAGYEPLESRFPLWLVSPASEHRTSSTFGNLRWSEEVSVELHPQDAAARGLVDGQRVRVWNDLGEVYLPLRVTDDVPPRVACSLKGAWLRTAENGQTVSALAPGHHADIAGGACYNDARVEIEAA